MAALNGDGLLPEGTHDLSLDEVAALFGRFKRSDRRLRLLEKLRRYIDAVRTLESLDAILIDGSFVTDKDEPDDIDLILVLRAGYAEQAEWQPHEYNVVSPRRVSRTYGFDILVARADGPELDSHINYFAQVKGQPQLRKGIVKLKT